MESISEYLNLDPRVVFIVVVVAVLTVFILVVKWLVAKTRDDSLYDDLDNDRDEDESDESEDDEEPEERFFRVPSYDLPDDWDDTFEIIVDRKTKVQYLCYGDYGITPFIDADGKPILYKDKYQEQDESE
jgi:hypothetical protein